MKKISLGCGYCAIHSLTLLLVLLGSIVGVNMFPNNDYYPVNIPIVFDGEAHAPFVLNYSNIHRWEEDLQTFCKICTPEEYQLVYARTKQILYEEQLFPEAFLSQQNRKNRAQSQPFMGIKDSLSLLLKPTTFKNGQKQGVSEQPAPKSREYYFTSFKMHEKYKKMNAKSFIKRKDIEEYMNKPSHSTLLPAFMQEFQTPIVIYQSRNSFTGGTTAMRILFTTLQQLGYPTILCNDTNYAQTQCSQPSDASIVITGEWCQEVMNEYLKYPESHYAYPEERHFSTKEVKAEKDIHSYYHNEFPGRGIQYYLGFHHGRHQCRGWIATTDSHYLYTQLGNRGNAAYFLGCPMSEVVEESVKILLHQLYPEDENDTEERKPKRQTVDAMSDEIIQPPFVNIEKENLIIVDMDLFKDYPTELPYELYINASYKVKLLQNVPPHEIPFLLQRSKIVVDLAMPGPERITSESVLFGNIPIVSSLWNGKSAIDFPGKHKINPFIPTQLGDTIEYIMQNYESELQTTEHLQHWQYIMSMWNRLSNTVDVMFASSRLHFVLIPRTMEEEEAVMYQLLSLWYLFPLASVDLYVQDSAWFLRNYYGFVDAMKLAGYYRLDPMDPREHEIFRTQDDYDAHRGTLIDEMKEIERSRLGYPPSKEKESNSTDPAQLKRKEQQAKQKERRSALFAKKDHKIISYLRIFNWKRLEDQLNQNVDIIENTTDSTTVTFEYDMRLSTTLLIPHWQPIFIYLPYGMIWQDPIVFLERIATLKSEEIQVYKSPWKQSSNKGKTRSNKLGFSVEEMIIAAPNCPLSLLRNTLQYLSSLTVLDLTIEQRPPIDFHPWLADVRFVFPSSSSSSIASENNKKEKKDGQFSPITKQHVTHVCTLYAVSSDQLQETEELINGVIQTPLWNTMKYMSKEHEFVCPG